MQDLRRLTVDRRLQHLTLLLLVDPLDTAYDKLVGGGGGSQSVLVFVLLGITLCPF